MKMKASFTVAWAVSLTLLGCTTESTPEEERLTAVDTFGPGMTYQNNLGWSLSGPLSDNQVNGDPWVSEQAFLFPGQDGIVTDIWVSLGYGAFQRKPGKVAFHLDENEEGLPGRTLESWTVEAGFHLFDSTVSPIRLVGKGGTRLHKNRTYWLRGKADDTSWVGWDMTPDPKRTCTNTERRASGIWDEPGQVTCSVFKVEIRSE